MASLQWKWASLEPVHDGELEYTVAKSTGEAQFACCKEHHEGPFSQRAADRKQV
jgi:hypothetical protein